MAAIGVLHPGAMGAAVAAALADVGHDVAWASAGRSADTARRAERLRDAGDVAGLLGSCEVVLSICPPDRALEVARDAASFTGLYVDANAIAPATSDAVRASVGGRFADGAIIGGPPHAAGTTRLYLSGPDAAEVAALFSGSRLDARVLDGAPTAASALKMTYAAWAKGHRALLLAVRAAAEGLGVGDELVAEWALSTPGLAQRAEEADAMAVEKGWRWAGEMREIAGALASAGQPAGFHEAAAEVYASYERPASATPPIPD